MRRRTLLALLMLAAVLLGAVREFLFLNLNYQLDAVANQRTVSYAHSLFRQWTAGLDLAALLRLKWALALLFTAVMLGLSVACARIVFGDHRYRRVVVLGFALVGAVALLLNALSAALPALYGVSVKLLHLLQYPVVLFVLWAASLLPRSAR
ncbi:MAG: hypothetical protein R2817_14245 [Flavobacteriales bacterium]